MENPQEVLIAPNDLPKCGQLIDFYSRYRRFNTYDVL